MTGENDNPITDSAQPEVVDATPGAGGVESSTPAPTVSDDASKYKSQLEDLQARLAARERDINQMKSSLQSENARLKREYEERIALMKMDGMDESERSLYQRQLREKEYSEMQEKYAEMERKLQEREYIDNYQRIFADMGVAPERLDYSDGLNSVFNSGWGAAKKRMKELEEEIAQLKSKSTPNAQKPTPTAPDVANLGGTPTSSKITFAEILQKYGSLENYYRLIESGRLGENPPIPVF